MSAFDCFLEIDGITGESQGAGHRDAIDVLSFRWGESQHAPAQSGLGAGVGQVRVEDLQVTSGTGKASPRLMVACAGGLHIAHARLICRLADVADADAEFLVITLSNVLVSRYQVAGDTNSGGTSPTDEMAFNFRNIKIEYRARRPDGSLDRAVTGAWNVQDNRGA
jgi:type VI secretion system secreted protein Hcp